MIAAAQITAFAIEALCNFFIRGHLPPIAIWDFAWYDFVGLNGWSVQSVYTNVLQNAIPWRGGIAKRPKKKLLDRVRGTVVYVDT
jgi:hypothetical protein